MEICALFWSFMPFVFILLFYRLTLSYFLKHFALFQFSLFSFSQLVLVNVLGCVWWSVGVCGEIRIVNHLGYLFFP